eukprot:CAMPEP_0181106418 /NCGR_PEP_ID=MMETSP1071-20121207/16522_1 /TAXON_ID=35127 /ORGANISM="Thalassiosira sp., Strain NH16" /LENGTH=262 /DNA_ID=CAMNT_0023189825 /DNA_START=283 /DNA_END=1071 /DNA_ORIENTATION=-
MHRRPPQIRLIHRKIHVRRPRRIPPLHIHAPVRVQRRPDGVILPQLAIPRQAQTAVPSDRGRDHVLVVQLLGYGDYLIVLGGGDLDEGIVRVVRHDDICVVIINIVPRIDRHAIAVVVKALREFHERHAGALQLLPHVRGRRSDQSEFQVVLLVLAVDLEIYSIHGLDVHFESGGEGVPVGDDAGGAAPDTTGKGGEVGGSGREVDSVPQSDIIRQQRGILPRDGRIQSLDIGEVAIANGNRQLRPMVDAGTSGNTGRADDG